jgi:transposase-like protein
MERKVALNIVPKRYDESFKRQVVEMVVHGDRRVVEVAKELGVSDFSIYQWKKKYISAPGSRKAGGGKAAANGLPQSVEELQKLVRDLLREPERILSVAKPPELTEQPSATRRGLIPRHYSG